MGSTITSQKTTLSPAAVLASLTYSVARALPGASGTIIVDWGLRKRPQLFPGLSHDIGWSAVARPPWGALNIKPPYVALAIIALISMACSQPAPSPSPTPDIEGTVVARVGATAEAMSALSPTPLPTVVATSVPTPTPAPDTARQVYLSSVTELERTLGDVLDRSADYIEDAFPTVPLGPSAEWTAALAEWTAGLRGFIGEAEGLIDAWTALEPPNDLTDAHTIFQQALGENLALLQAALIWDWDAVIIHSERAASFSEAADALFANAHGAAPIESGVLASFADGTFLVSTEIAPGTYASHNASGTCYWARLSGFSGEPSDIIANDASSGQAIVTIESTDFGFESMACGTWIRVQRAAGASTARPAPTVGPPPPPPSAPRPQTHTHAHSVTVSADDFPGLDNQTRQYLANMRHILSVQIWEILPLRGCPPPNAWAGCGAVDRAVYQAVASQLDRIQPPPSSPFYGRHVAYSTALDKLVAATLETLPHLRAVAPTVVQRYTSVNCTTAGGVWGELEHVTELRTRNRSLDILALSLCPQVDEARDAVAAASIEWSTTLFVCDSGWETCLKP